MFNILLCLFIFSCKKHTSSVSEISNPHEEKEIRASIVTLILDAPFDTLMKDRFKLEHRSYYLGKLSDFFLIKYAVTNDRTSYFLILRPRKGKDTYRYVGGHFKLKENYKLEKFHEAFVSHVI